jgi:hypothetical protein
VVCFAAERAPAASSRPSTGELGGGLPEDGEVPQESVAALAIRVESLGSLADGEEMCLLGRVDHLLEQEEFTPHTGSVPRTGRRP